VRLHFNSLPILVPCTVAGTNRSVDPRLVLDTGASVTVLNVGFLRLIGLNPADSPEICYLTTASGVVKAPIVRVALFTTLGVTKLNFPVAAYKLPSHSNVSGLLGTDFLSDQVVVVNFKKRWVEIK